MLDGVCKFILTLYAGLQVSNSAANADLQKNKMMKDRLIKEKKDK